METLEKINLRERTRKRNESVWVNFDWGGLMAPLDDQQTALDALSRHFVENYIAIADEQLEIKETQRDRNFEIDQAEIDQGKRIADEKVAMERQKLAIKIATQEYQLATRVYEAKVKSLIMGAKEYAAQVEREQLVVERSRAELSVAEEGLKLDEINAKIYYQYIERAQVEADLAKAQVEVAKANVRALMSDIEAGEAEIRVIKADVEKAMSVAEAATLEADIARIHAQILTKQLSAIKLAASEAEISAEFGAISAKLSAHIALWAAKGVTEDVRAAGLAQVAAMLPALTAAEKAAEDLKLKAIQDAKVVFEQEKTETEANLALDLAIQMALAKAKEGLAKARMQLASGREVAQTNAIKAENVARKFVYLNSTRLHTSITRSQEHISGG